MEAWYGRKSTSVCPHSLMGNTDCSSDPGTSLLKVKELCQGKSSCTITAGYSIFGDPCYGTNKYLSLSYKCVESKFLLIKFLVS